MNVSYDLYLTPYFIHRNGTIEDYTQQLEPYGYRTMFDIFRTCLLTILLCTWAALHSNIPSYDHWAFRLWYRTNLFLVALVTPDLVILWAAKQFFAARALAKEYEGVPRL